MREFKVRLSVEPYKTRGERTTSVHIDNIVRVRVIVGNNNGILFNDSEGFQFITVVLLTHNTTHLTTHISCHKTHNNGLSKANHHLSFNPLAAPGKMRSLLENKDFHLVIALLVISLRNTSVVDCFASNPSSLALSLSSLSTGSTFHFSLFAKSRQKKNKTGRRGRRGSNQLVHEEINSQREPKVENNESSDKKTGKFLQKPKKTKKCWVRLDGLPSSTPLDVCLIEINDASWWEHEDNTNPFGARLWPPSLALAKFLAKFLAKYPLDVNQVIEVGCGTGLISIAAAASGATAIATDVSDVALSLVKEGWSETSLRRHKTKSPIGNLTVSSFDVFSNDPLPFRKVSGKQQQESSSILSSPRCILVASAVLYDKNLAKAMSKRVMEACEYGAWVILADDDTGLREGGRAIFESEWEKLVAEKKETRMNIRSQWTHETVQQRDVFGWADKKVQLLHLNYPIKPGVLE